MADHGTVNLILGVPQRHRRRRRQQRSYRVSRKASPLLVCGTPGSGDPRGDVAGNNMRRMTESAGVFWMGKGHFLIHTAVGQSESYTH